MSDQLIAGLMSMRERLKLFGDQMDGDITHIDETIAHIRTLKKQVALLTTPQSSAPVVGDALRAAAQAVVTGKVNPHAGRTRLVMLKDVQALESALTGRGE